jgi:putative endonuclease
MSERLYHTYILASRSRILYTGVTGRLLHRVREHREGLVPGFTTKYRIHRLVYFEAFHDVRTAIGLEKQIKGWNRAKKVALIESRNPAWTDLAVEFFSKFPRKADPSPQKGRLRDDKCG